MQNQHVLHVIQVKNGIIKILNESVKIGAKSRKKIISGILTTHVFMRIATI